MTISGENVLARITIAGLCLGVLSCGPMNQGVSATAAHSSSCSNEQQSDGTSEGIGFSKSHEFIIINRLKTSSDDIHEKAQFGNNVYQFRIFHASDMTPITTEATVSVSYTSSRGSTPANGNTDAERQSDGSYQATLEFTKMGAWQVQINVKEGSLDDAHAFSVSI
jgi:hypothetical protein